MFRSQMVDAKQGGGPPKVVYSNQFTFPSDVIFILLSVKQMKGKEGMSNFYE